MHSLTRSAVLPIKLKEAWEFFSNPRNLSKITPDELGFKITSNLPDGPMYPGMIIMYKVSPLFKVRMTWVTEITQVEKHKFFVDEQKVGPYSIWHHQHHFEEVEGGVKMTDIVHYKLPLGILGRLIEPIIVRPKLESIFNYRSEVIQKEFGV